jgi:hypothetical protein
LLVKPKTGRGRTMMEATGMRKRSSAEDWGEENTQPWQEGPGKSKMSGQKQLQCWVSKMES